MADAPVSDKLLRIMIESPNVYAAALRLEAGRRGFRVADKQPIENVVAFLRSSLRMSMDAIEVSMPDGTEVCVDPKGDEARAGMMSALLYATSARCPYCTKSVSMSRATLGFHRGPGGVCLGSEKAVARIDMGHAVLSTFAWVNPGDRVRYKGKSGPSWEGTVLGPSKPGSLIMKVRWDSGSESYVSEANVDIVR